MKKISAEGRIILVTGMSGAGRTSTLHVFEDIGYEAVDNLPISLLNDLVKGADSNRALAIGVDIRTRDFEIKTFERGVFNLKNSDGVLPTTIFLDCDDEVLIKRYTETRRRHPLSGDRPLGDGIILERRLLDRVRDCVDLVIDTSQLTPWELKRQLTELFVLEENFRLSVCVTSFSYRRGIPRESDLVFDVRFLRNPHYKKELRLFTGRDRGVGSYIAEDVDFEGFLDSLKNMLDLLLPRFEAEGKSYLTIAIGCTGGQHRSVFVGELLNDWIGKKGMKVQLHHRDLSHKG